MASWEEHLERWMRAGVVDAATAERVRAYESTQEMPDEHRWQVAVMLSLGVILLVGGTMLFVGSHWNQVSPWQQLSLVMGFLAIFHALAVVSAKRFPGMATALHGVGTAGAGAAILTVGQIFNMQEHWPTVMLLWAICAGTGCWLLRDQVQQVLTMVLVPAWFVCEWSYYAEGYRSSDIYIARMAAVIAAVFITSFLASRRRGVFWSLYVIGALGLIVATVNLSRGWNSWEHEPTLPIGLRFASIAIIAATITAGWLWERRNLMPVLAVALAAYLLPWRPVYAVQQPYPHDEPGAIMYALVATVCVVVAWWALRQKSRAVVNYAVVVFGMTILWFYSSSLMNKLGRSLGLIGLGTLFLLGGVVLERLRRTLIAGMAVQV